MSLATAGEAPPEGAAPHAPALPLVLVHGYLGGAEQWREQVDVFSQHRKVIAVDLPGFGRAAQEPSPATIGGFAAHVIATLDDTGIDRFALLGHSMGGMIAQEIAHRIPGRIERLVLYGTGPLGSMPDRFEPLEVSLARLDEDGVPNTARRIVATWFSQGEGHPGFEILSRLGATANPNAAQSALSAMAQWDGRMHLRALEIPALIIWGDEDRSYRWPQVETLWRDLPKASLAVIPGASHAAHLEKPEIFMAILKDFLN